MAIITDGTEDSDDSTNERGKSGTIMPPVTLLRKLSNLPVHLDRFERARGMVRKLSSPSSAPFQKKKKLFFVIFCVFRKAWHPEFRSCIWDSDDDISLALVVE